MRIKKSQISFLLGDEQMETTMRYLDITNQHLFDMIRFTPGRFSKKVLIY